MLLGAQPNEIARPEFRTTNLRAQEVPIGGSQEATIALTRTILAGDPFPIGNHVLRFCGEENRPCTAYHDHAASAHGKWHGEYTDRLVLSGASKWNVLNARQVELERELRPHGYQTINDLAKDYGLDLLSTDSLSIEFVAQPIAAIDRGSRLISRTAELTVRLPVSLARDQFALTLVDVPSGGLSIRRRVAHNEFSWTTSGSQWTGTCAVSVPHVTLLSSRAVYAGSLHDELELVDLDALPNRRRMIVELADPGLRRLQGPLLHPKNHNEQNEFESGIAVLLFMLGLDSVRVGGIKKLSEAADIFAATPAEILIVECATEVLDPRDKIGKLLARVEEARRKLPQAVLGIDPTSITGAIVIPKNRDELGSEWKLAEQRGILVLCRSDIEQALALTRLPPDVSAVLQRWRQRPMTTLLTRRLDVADESS